MAANNEGNTSIKLIESISFQWTVPASSVALYCYSIRCWRVYKARNDGDGRAAVAFEHGGRESAQRNFDD